MNSFEKFWKNWDKTMTEQQNRAGGIEIGFYTEMKEEFFCLCEKQAKKADMRGRKDDVFGSSMYEYGHMNAFRLVQGRRLESESFGLLKGQAQSKYACGEIQRPTKKRAGGSFDEKKKVSAIALPAGSKVREPPLTQPQKKR